MSSKRKPVLVSDLTRTASGKRKTTSRRELQEDVEAREAYDFISESVDEPLEPKAAPKRKPRPKESAPEDRPFRKPASQDWPLPINIVRAIKQFTGTAKTARSHLKKYGFVRSSQELVLFLFEQGAVWYKKRR